MDKDKVKIYTCEFTGLPVYELKEFTNVDFGNGYKVNLRKIGDSIIYSKNSGDMKYSDITRYYQLVEEFIPQANIIKPIVEIRDLENLTGRASVSQNRSQKLFFVNHKKDFAAFIVCNSPSWMVLMLKAAIKLNYTPIDFFFYNNYREAILKASNVILHKNEATYTPLKYEDIIFKPEWVAEGSDYKVT